MVFKPLTDAIRYPSNRENAVTNPILVGGFVVLLSNTIIALPLLFGYYRRVVETTLAGDPEPPEFEHWGQLYIDGIVPSILGSLAILVPSFLIGVAIALSAPSSSGAEGSGISVVLLVGSIPLIAAFWYFVPILIGNMVVADGLPGLLDIPATVEVAFDRRYFAAWGYATLLYILVIFGSAVLIAIPLLGFLILMLTGLFISFYTTTSSFYLYARGYAKARELRPSRLDVDATGMAAEATESESHLSMSSQEFKQPSSPGSSDDAED